MRRMLFLILITASICALTAFALADPPVNDDCANATDAGTLSAGSPVQLSGSLIDATNDCPNHWYSEVWVKFTITSATDVTIDYCDDGNYLYMVASELFTECPCGEAIYSGNQGYCGNMNPSLTWYGLSAGTYYYSIANMDEKSAKAGSYTINITGEIPPDPPTNDDCSNAIAVGEVVDQAYTTLGATFDGGGACMISGNVWYVYTATFTGSARINLDASYNSRIAAYDGYSCTPLPSELGCEDTMLDFAVVTGNQYLIEIGGSGASAGDGTFSIGETPEPPANDNCADATDAGTLIDGNPVQLSGSLVEATVDCWDNESPEVWVKFTVSSCMDVTIDFCDQEDELYGASRQLYTGCPCDGMMYYNSSENCPLTGNPIITWQNLEAGTYYYPICLNYGSIDDYTVNITGTDCPPPPDNDNCSGAIAIGEVTDYEFTTRGATHDGQGSCINESPNVWFIYTSSFTGDARINLNGSQFGTLIAVYDGASCSPFPLEIDCVEESNLNFMVVSGQQYLIEIGASDDQGGAGLLTVGEVPEAPPNDDCDDADDAGTLVSGVTAQLTGTTAGATQDCSMNYFPEVWVKFTIPSCMDVTIDYCNNASRVPYAAEQLHYDCSCYDYFYANNQEHCDTDNPILLFYGIEAGTYYYPVWAVNGGEPYTLNITGVDCPLPPEPDYVVTAPYSGSSTTCGAGDDCRIPYQGEDHLYEVTIPTDGSWLFSLCNTESMWESTIDLGTSACDWDIELENFQCDNPFHGAKAAYGIEAGVYYLNIDGSGMACGEYTLDIINIPPPCEASYLTNGDPNYENAIASYRNSSYDYDYFACDDFTITEDITLDSIKFICAYDGGDDTYFNRRGDYIIMANDNGAPGAVLFEATDYDCSRVYTTEDYINNEMAYAYQFGDLDIELTAGTYFLACRTVSSDNLWLATDSQNGSTAYYRDDEITTWTPAGINADLTFCLFASTGGDTYEYLPGDANMSTGNWPPSTIGGDVTYLVNYFRGITAACMLDGFYASADANGDCRVTGADVTKLVSYFRGMDDLNYCVDYPTTWPPIPDTAPDGWPNCASPVLSK